jgi:hypothetical protein
MEKTVPEKTHHRLNHQSETFLQVIGHLFKGLYLVQHRLALTSGQLRVKLVKPALLN